MSSNFSSSALFDVEGYVAVVTGGGTGIGSWVAQALVQNGATVYITGRRTDVLKKAADQLNALTGAKGRAVPFTTDVTSKEDVQRLVKFVAEREQCVDLLVNNAGAVAPEPPTPFKAPLEDIQSAMWSSSMEKWDSQFGPNTWGPYIVTTGFLHLLAEAAKKGNGRGSVVIISSGAARLWNPHVNVVGYTLSKIAAEQLSKILAARLYSYGIRVNVVSPGSFPTDMNPPEYELSLSNPANNVNLPLGRPGAAEEIVGPVLLLASRAGAYISGVTLDVDGGLMLIANGTNKIAP